MKLPRAPVVRMTPDERLFAVLLMVGCLMVVLGVVVIVR